MIFKYLEWIRLLCDMKRYQKVDDYDGTVRPEHLYKFYPEGAVCSDGSRYHALFRTGPENKLLIVLDGGGFAYDKYTAARPSGDAFDENNPTFYDAWCKPSKNAYARLSMFHEKCRQSPFYGWSLLYVPYATGDFHIGNSEFPYKDENGEDKILYFNGHNVTEQLKEYLSGQYSDGWGEGFEQREVYSYTETETSEEYDEEADEYYESEWDVRYDVYISFWQDKNFRLMTEAELKA